MSRLWRESVFFLFLSVFGFSGCDKDIQMVSLGIDDIYYLPRMKAYALHPAFTGEEYRWTLRSDGRDSLLSEKRDYIFLAKDTGTYDLTFEIIDPTTPYKHDFRFVVMHEELNIVPISRKSMNTVPRQANLSISCLNIRKVKRRRIYEKKWRKIFPAQMTR